VPDLILELLEDAQYNVKLPSAAGEFTEVEIVLPVPFIGPITVTAARDGAELVFDPVTLDGIDLSDFGLPGVACLVGGTAAGSTNGFGNDELQVTITVSDMSVTPSGGGTCDLPRPGPTCGLEVISDGQRLRTTP
jgi:hypothetical protein